MAQHDYVIANGTGSAVRSDLNNALAAIVSQNSGASEPSPTFAFQLWADTTTNTLKLRNSANSAWIELRQLDGDFTKVSVDNGTAGAPSIYFNASGTDTGFYSSGTDALDFSTAGTRRLGIASGGDLTVYGGNVTLNAQGDLRFADSDSSNWVAFQSPATVSSNVTWTLPSADGTNGQALTTNGSGTLSWTSPTSTTDKITEGNTEAEVVDTGSDGHFKVTTEGTERLRVDSSGRVGIGSTSPSTVLHCESAQAEVNIKSTSGTNSAGVRFVPGGQTNAWYIYANGNRNLVFDDHASERMRIDASGRLLVGTSTSAGINPSNVGRTIAPLIQISGDGASTTAAASLQITDTANSDWALGANIQLIKDAGSTAPGNGWALGGIFISGEDTSGTLKTGASIVAKADGQSWLSGDCPTRLEFSTTADGASSPTERMRIASDGSIFIAKTGYSSGTVGIELQSSGFASWTRSGGSVGLFNRLADDGDLVLFRQADVTEGSISVSGTTVSYNGAHLSRWSQLPGGATREEILRGTVLSNIDEMCNWGEEENEQLNRIKVSDVEGDPNVAGVFQSWDDDDDTYTDDFYCAMTGDFIIRIAEGVTVQRGDLLMSAGDGTAKPQDDDIVRSKTVAKVTSTHVTCTYDDGSYCVPCVLMAC